MLVATSCSFIAAPRRLAGLDEQHGVVVIFTWLSCACRQSMLRHWRLRSRMQICHHRCRRSWRHALRQSHHGGGASRRWSRYAAAAAAGAPACSCCCCSCAGVQQGQRPHCQGHCSMRHNPAGPPFRHSTQQSRNTAVHGGIQVPS